MYKSHASRSSRDLQTVPTPVYTCLQYPASCPEQPPAIPSDPVGHSNFMIVCDPQAVLDYTIDQLCQSEKLQSAPRKNYQSLASLSQTQISVQHTGSTAPSTRHHQHICYSMRLSGGHELRVWA
eukprot:GHUV01031112.1.p1 GENE.GHUV01031112.1~~GHUV01031112.1.p1  ORF type:complete len:124 (-),score=7.80 GHUV01031112.1:402-773(-)